MKKNLYITGAHEIVNGKINYKLVLFGQFRNQACVFIKTLELTDSNYNEVEKICRAEFIKYFDTDEFNIISINHTIKVNNL